MQLPRAEVCEVVVVVVRRRMRGGGRSGDKEGDKAEAGGARYDSWRVMCWDASVKGVALVTTFDGRPLLVKVARVPRGQLKVFWSSAEKARQHKQDRGRGCARPPLATD